MYSIWTSLEFCCVVKSSGKIKYILKKGENAGYQHFLLFPKCIQQASSKKSGLCGKALTQQNFRMSKLKAGNNMKAAQIVNVYGS